MYSGLIVHITTLIFIYQCIFLHIHVPLSRAHSMFSVTFSELQLTRTLSDSLIYTLGLIDSSLSSGTSALSYIPTYHSPRATTKWLAGYKVSRSLPYWIIHLLSHSHTCISKCTHFSTNSFSALTLILCTACCVFLIRTLCCCSCCAVVAVVALASDADVTIAVAVIAVTVVTGTAGYILQR